MKSEREWAREILSMPPARGGGISVLELGAHHGNDTVELFAASIKPCRYVAVEADPRNVPVLRQRVDGLPVQILHAAVWNACEEIQFHLCIGNANGSSSAREPKEHLQHFPGIPFHGKAVVPALTLDRISATYEIGGVRLIWSDIQGAERDMVAGGQNTLSRTEWLLTECDRYEMYAGQAKRDELLDLLGPDWELIAEWPEDANLLLRNRRLA